MVSEITCVALALLSTGSFVALFVYIFEFHDRDVRHTLLWGSTGEGLSESFMESLSVGNAHKKLAKLYCPLKIEGKV